MFSRPRAVRVALVGLVSMAACNNGPTVTAGNDVFFDNYTPYPATLQIAGHSSGTVAAGQEGFVGWPVSGSQATQSFTATLVVNTGAAYMSTYFANLRGQTLGSGGITITFQPDGFTFTRTLQIDNAVVMTCSAVWISTPIYAVGIYGPALDCGPR